MNKLSDRPRKVLFICDQGIRNLVDIDQIIRMEPRRRYTLVFIKSGHPIVSWRHLKYYERELSIYHFVRVHRCHLINMLELKSFQLERGGKALMNDGSEVIISHGFKANFLKAVDGLTRMVG